VIRMLTSEKKLISPPGIFRDCVCRDSRFACS
jgi:hypothetical protein